MRMRGLLPLWDDAGCGEVESVGLAAAKGIRVPGAEAATVRVEGDRGRVTNPIMLIGRVLTKAKDVLVSNRNVLLV